MRAVPDFHPEFGTLCPSPRRRRGIRLAVLCIVTTMAIGATMGLAVARWPDGGGAASPAEPINGEPLARVSAAGAEATAGHRSCRPDKVDTVADLLSLFLAPDCGSSKSHVRHGARADNNRVATVVIGRTDAPPPAASAPIAATALPEAEVGNAEKPANEIAAAAEPTKSLKKPKPKLRSPIALTPSARELSRQNGTLNPYATANFGRETYDPYRNPYRATAQQPGYGSFNRSW